MVFILFLLLCFSSVWDGVREYQHIIKNKKKFQEVERENVGKFVTYSQYGLYGFRLMFLPSPLSALFVDPAAAPELTAFVDSGVRLRLYHSVLGKNLYDEKNPGFLDFSGILLLFGSILVLLLGYNSFRPREYLRHLSSILGHRKAFALVIAARMILTGVLFLFTVGCVPLLMRLNHIVLSGREYAHLLVFVIITLLMLWFFLLLGAAAGSIKSKSSGFITVVALWFVFVFLIPGTISKIVSKKADNMSSAYNLEQEKLKILSEFEKKALARTLRYTTVEEKKDADRKSAESYWDNELKKIQAIEKKMEIEAGNNVNLFQALSMLFPTSFYISAASEIDSRGYRNVIDFYAYVQKLKSSFVRFYFDKKYYSNYSGVESFVQDDENVFYAPSRLPGYVFPGMVLILIYIACLFVFSFYRLKSFLFARSGKDAEEVNGLDVELKTGETYVLLTNGRVLNDRLYKFFSVPDKDFKGLVRLDDVSLASDESEVRKSGFVYFCRPCEVPAGIRVGDFIRFISRALGASNKSVAELYMRLGEHIEKKNFGSLPVVEKFKVMLEIGRLKGSKVYMFHDFALRAPAGFLESFMEELKALKGRGMAVLYLTGDVLLAAKIGDSAGSLRAPNVPRLDAYDLV